MNPYAPPQANFKPLQQTPAASHQAVLKACIFASYATLLLIFAVMALVAIPYVSPFWWFFRDSP